MPDQSPNKTYLPNIAYLANSEESQYSKHIPASIQASGGNPIQLDYHNSVVDIKKLDQQALKEMLADTGDKMVAVLYRLLGDSTFKQQFITELRKKSDVALQKELMSWIKEQNISGIMIPGDYFNYDCPPFHPEPKTRPRFTKALLAIAKELQMPLFGVCGGLQAVMAAEEIKLARVSDILKKTGVDPSEAELHIISDRDSDIDPNFLARNARRQEILPHTRTASLCQNGHLLIPEAHGGAIDSSNPQAIIDIYRKGYQIAGVSPDGIIQIVEHKNLPINLFQGHPEALAAVKDSTCVTVMEKLLVEPARQYAQKYQQNAVTLVSANQCAIEYRQLMQNNMQAERMAGCVQ